jgi:hypothetical protein
MQGRKTLVSNVVYIADAWFPVGNENNNDLLKWLHNLSDIIELPELDNGFGKNVMFFSLLLAMTMTWLKSIILCWKT